MISGGLKRLITLLHRVGIHIHFITEPFEFLAHLGHAAFGIIL